MNYRNTFSWQASLELVPQLVRLAEELPTSEEQGMTRHLHDLVVELPAAVAFDLETGGNTRIPHVFKLSAALAAIEAVYPAIDASEIVTAAQGLDERLRGQQFAEEIPAPAPATPDAENETPPEPETPDEPEETEEPEEPEEPTPPPSAPIKITPVTSEDV